jgi:hypothetical protein
VRPTATDMRGTTMFDDPQLQVFFWVLVASVLFFVFSILAGVDAYGDADVVQTPDGGDGHAAVSWNILSFRNLFLFGIGFGAVGFLSTKAGYGVATSVAGGIAAGAVIAAIGVWFFRLISSQESNTVTDPAELVGRKASVTTAIPAAGLGEVLAVNEHGTQVSLFAQSNGTAILGGTRVVIVAAAGDRVTVRPE